MGILNRFLFATLCGIIIYIIFYSSLSFKKYVTNDFDKNISDCECKLFLKQKTIKEEKEEDHHVNCHKKHYFKPGLRLLYNRVPKCGSTTLYTLMRKLSKVNGYKHFNSKIYDKRILDFAEQVRLIV